MKNETTNKVYIYDNIGRTKLTALEADANFVPLEIMQQATREEVQLKEIKEQVVEEKIFFCRKLLIDNFILIADLVIQNLLSIGIHTRHNLCFHIDLRIISVQFILFFLLDDLFFDLGQLC